LGGYSNNDGSVENNPENFQTGQPAIESKGKPRTRTDLGTICNVFASVFTITEFALQYNVPNHVIGVDAKDHAKVELLAASLSLSKPRLAPIAFPAQPQISVHRRSSCPFNLPQKPACPGFKALTSYFGCLHPSWRKFESEHKDDWKKIDDMLRPRAIDIIRSCHELGNVIAEHEELVKQLYNAGESMTINAAEKDIQGTDTHCVRIPPVNFPGFTLDSDGHIRGGESEQSDTW